MHRALSLITCAVLACTSPGAPNPISPQALPTLPTVILRDEGFEPQTVSISSGNSVAFINESASARQVASDPHPLHSDCPELNGPLLESGGTFIATMTMASAVCGFHDELDLGLVGSITVLPGASGVATSVPAGETTPGAPADDGSGAPPVTTAPTGTTGATGSTGLTGLTGLTGTTGSTVVTITISAFGLEPSAAIVVAPGATVGFLNMDTLVHELVSDPHPGHDLCPFLNGPRLGSGENHAFTIPDGERVCSFHDEQNPGDPRYRGEISIR